MKFSSPENSIKMKKNKEEEKFEGQTETDKDYPNCLLLPVEGVGSTTRPAPSTERSRNPLPTILRRPIEILRPAAPPGGNLGGSGVVVSGSHLRL